MLKGKTKKKPKKQNKQKTKQKNTTEWYNAMHNELITTSSEGLNDVWRHTPFYITVKTIHFSKIYNKTQPANWSVLLQLQCDDSMDCSLAMLNVPLG